jgi:hypothetical protein
MVIAVAERRLVARVVVAGALLAGLTHLFAYRLGKDCGAWEAHQRLRGLERPTLCFSGP